MKKKVLSALLSVCLCLSMPLQVNAAETENAITAYSSATTVEPLAAGLIIDYFISCKTSSRTIYITAQVYASDEMKELGFKNIVVQRSSDKINWTTEVPVGDMIGNNIYSYDIDEYPVTVKGGYYYRVKLTNYAKEKGWFFPSTQSVDDTSSSYWIP